MICDRCEQRFALDEMVQDFIHREFDNDKITLCNNCYFQIQGEAFLTRYDRLKNLKPGTTAKEILEMYERSEQNGR